jgi:hypothetical protein
MQVARSDYKPYDYFHVHDPFEAPYGFVSEIKDFAASVSYMIYKVSVLFNFLSLSLSLSLSLGPYSQHFIFFVSYEWYQ